jgi:two-component system, LytTR family, sensor kinase
MELARLIALVQTSALGMAVSLLLIALLIRQKNADAGVRIGVVLGGCIFSMYAGVCVFSVCGYYKVPIPAWIVHPLLWVIAFLPALIVWSWRESPVLRWKSKTSAWLVVGSFLCGTAIVAISHRFGPEPNRSPAFVRLLALHRALWLAPAIVSILRLSLDARLKTFMKVTSFSYLAASSIYAIRTPGMDKTSVFGIALLVVAQGCGLGGIIGSFIVVARFRLVDVFLRWSTRIAILGLLSLIGSVSFVLVESDPHVVHRSAGILACSLEMAILLLLGKMLTEHAEGWVNSHVLQRIDLKVEAIRLRNGLFSMENRDDLFSFVETELTQSLEARDVRIVPLACVPPEVLAREDAPNATLEINSWNTPIEAGPLRDVDVLVPIPLNGDTEEMIGVSTGAGRQSLNSGEIGFLKELGLELGVRLHHLKVEAAHRRQAMRETLLRQELTEAELRALRAQVNPHFLFNSLNTIADLIIRDPAKAERMTLRLSSVFRRVLTKADHQFITLGEEFEFLRNYLDIEQERFGENLRVHLALHPELSDVRIPTLLLQPLVENALKHGLGPKGGRRSLEITAGVSAETIIMQVIDDGVGFLKPASAPRSDRLHAGVGLANTRARLHSAYGKDGCLQIDSTPMKGCRVVVSIPYRKAQA